MLPNIKQKSQKPKKKVHFRDVSNRPSIVSLPVPPPAAHQKSRSLINLNLLFNKSKVLESDQKESPLSEFTRAPEKKPSQKELLSYSIRSYIDKNFKYPSSSTVPNKVLYPGDWKYNSKQVLDHGLISEFSLESPEIGIYSIKYLSKLAEPEVLLPEEAQEIFYWREVKSYGIETREGATIVKLSGNIVLFGGLNRQKHNEVSQFSMLNLEWKNLQTLYTPKERSGHTAVSYKHKMVIYGGCGDYSSKFAQRRCDKKVNILSMKNLKWQVFEGKGHIPRARRNHAACRLGRFMIVFGGIDKMGRSLASCFAFNLKTHAWNVIPEGPFEISHCTITPVYPSLLMDSFNYDVFSVPNSASNLAKRGFYVFGGLLNSGLVNEQVWVMNLGSESIWTRLETVGKPPTPRHSHTVEVLKKYLIVFGGRNDTFYSHYNGLVTDIGVLDLTNLNWQSISSEGDVPRSRWGHCSCVYENKLIIFGGIDYKQFMQSSLFYMNIEKKS